VDRVFDLRPLLRRESRWAPWARRPRQPAQPGRIERAHAGANCLLVGVEPLTDLKAALAIHRPQDGVRVCAQPHISGTTKGRPHVLSCHRCVGNRKQLQPLPSRIFFPLYQEGPKAGIILLDYCRGLQLEVG